MSALARKLYQAEAYAHDLAQDDARSGHYRSEAGTLWTVEKRTRKQFAYSDQNTILRAYDQSWVSAHSATI